MKRNWDPEKLHPDDPAQLEMRAQRKAKIMRRVAIVLCLLAGVGLGLLLRQCKPAEQSAKVFDADGLKLTLDARFQETGARDGFDRAYKANHMAAYVRKHGPETAAALEDYAAFSGAELGAEGTELHRENGLTWLEYSAVVGGEAQSCLAAFYPGSDGWWTVVFCCEDSRYESCRPDFLQFAAAVVSP